MNDDRVISMADFIRSKEEVEGKKYIQADIPLEELMFIRRVVDDIIKDGTGNMYELFQAFVMLGDIVDPLMEHIDTEEYEDE